MAQRGEESKGEREEREGGREESRTTEQRKVLFMQLDLDQDHTQANTLSGVLCTPLPSSHLHAREVPNLDALYNPQSAARNLKHHRSSTENLFSTAAQNISHVTIFRDSVDGVRLQVH